MRNLTGTPFCLLLFAALLSVALATLPASGAWAKSKKGNPRYASLVVDVDTGKVLYSRNAKAQRYPASLTKMMTLYLLFDALQRGEVGMSDKMPVSAKAAAQPSTNLSLKAGQRLGVEEAIKGLVIRSANDAAMVVAEHLGRTQWNFALMMNRKARELGMRDTVFRNPSGLPDSNQVTTALDMAKLGIALRRDFPEYYHYFSMRSFDFGGRSYTTHNRVLQRVEGADGLKTGYINASGFNVVTSVKRDGHNLVAVVMGGRTSSSRDNEMVAILDRTFTRLAEAKDKKATQVAAAARPAGRPTSLAALAPASGEALEGQGDQGALPENLPFAVGSSEAVRRPEESASASGPSRGWGVQVGVFTNRSQAMKAANRVQRSLDYPKARADVAGMKTAKRGTWHRARVIGLTESEARRACAALEARSKDCLVFRSVSG